MKKIFFALLLLTGGMAGAQDRWKVEFRPGLSFPIGNLAGSDINTGFGFEVTASYRFLKDVSGYAGWGWNMFASEKSSDKDISNEETGYTFGLQLNRPLNNSIDYFLRAGGIYNHLEIENGDALYADSGHELGWQVEGGLSVPIGAGFSVNPGLRFRQLSGNITLAGEKTGFDLRYVSVGVGISKSLP